jgi:hypothetical protein
MNVDADLAHLLLGPAEIGNDEQAFVFLTVDEHGYAHPALLSRAELDVSPDGLVLAVVASTRTKANLARDRRATLIAVGGTVAHYAKLRLMASIEDDPLLGASFDVIEHKRDSIGIELAPITFRPSASLAELEHWSSSARLLSALVARGSGAAGG